MVKELIEFKCEFCGKSFDNFQDAWLCEAHCEEKPDAKSCINCKHRYHDEYEILCDKKGFRSSSSPEYVPNCKMFERKE